MGELLLSSVGGRSGGGARRYDLVRYHLLLHRRCYDIASR